MFFAVNHFFRWFVYKQRFRNIPSQLHSRVAIFFSLTHCLFTMPANDHDDVLYNDRSDTLNSQRHHKSSSVDALQEDDHDKDFFFWYASMMIDTMFFDL
jgi:hypothetical protein